MEVWHFLPIVSRYSSVNVLNYFYWNLNDFLYRLNFNRLNWDLNFYPLNHDLRFRLIYVLTIRIWQNNVPVWWVRFIQRPFIQRSRKVIIVHIWGCHWQEVSRKRSYLRLLCLNSWSRIRLVLRSRQRFQGCVRHDSIFNQEILCLNSSIQFRRRKTLNFLDLYLFLR